MRNLPKCESTGFITRCLWPYCEAISGKRSACAGTERRFVPGGCAAVFRSVVFLAVIIGGTTVPAAFMCRAPGVLVLFVGLDFWEFLREVPPGGCSRPVTNAARRLAGCRDPMFPSNSLAWL